MKAGIPAWSVVMVVLSKDDHMLAINRQFNLRDPALPGGDSEATDATPAFTARRELKEETGLVALELRCVDQWEGERGQPVYAFYIPKWQGKLRSSDEGKPFWAWPKRFLTRTATFRETTQKLFEKIGVLDNAAKQSEP